MVMVKCNKSANSILGDMVNALFNQNARFADKNADGLRKAFDIKQNAKGEIDTTALSAGAIVTAPFR